MMPAMTRGEARNLHGRAPEGAGCGALLAFTVVVGGLAAVSLLSAAGAEFNAHWNSPADNAWGAVANAFVWLWTVVLLTGWVLHVLAPRALYHWKTLMVVLVLTGAVYWAVGGEYRALRRTEQAAQKQNVPAEEK